MNRSTPILGKALVVSVLALAGGCTTLTVTKLSDGDRMTKGLRYYLPKPYLQVTPQADGTISVDVVYLPDKSQSYAIDTSSYLSSYTFQATRDEKGLLTSLEFKASNSVVGQQLASSGGSYAAQAYNIKNAAAVAQQTQVNTAQTARDTARAVLASAEATLASDQAHNAKSDTITSDFAAVASAKAKAEISDEALQRAQTTAQLTSTAVSMGAPTTTSAPTIGTIFGQPTWSAPTTQSLPQQFGPVLYAVNDDGKSVKLVSVKAKLQDTTTASGMQKNVNQNAQPAFATTSMALGPPSLVPASQTQTTNSKQATFVFERPVQSLVPNGSSVATDATPPVIIATAVPKLTPDGKAVTVDTTGMSVGGYVVTVAYRYVVDPNNTMMSATKQVKLIVSR